MWVAGHYFFVSHNSRALWVKISVFDKTKYYVAQYPYSSLIDTFENVVFYRFYYPVHDLSCAMLVLNYKLLYYRIVFSSGFSCRHTIHTFRSDLILQIICQNAHYYCERTIINKIMKVHNFIWIDPILGIFEEGLLIRTGGHQLMRCTFLRMLEMLTVRFPFTTIIDQCTSHFSKINNKIPLFVLLLYICLRFSYINIETYSSNQQIYFNYLLNSALRHRSICQLHSTVISTHQSTPHITPQRVE